MLIYIFANGPNQNNLKSEITQKVPDLIIAADGGANHCLDVGILPDIVVGDLDSISETSRANLPPKQVEIIKFPTRKDATDLELALDLAMEKGGNQIVIFAGLGGRWDMSFSNVMLAASEKYKEMHVSLSAENSHLHILHANRKLALRGKSGQTISLIPLSQEAKGITLSGFEYPLKNETIQFGNSRGLSNVLEKNEGDITLSAGTLLCVHETI